MTKANLPELVVMVIDVNVDTCGFIEKDGAPQIFERCDCCPFCSTIEEAIRHFYGDGPGTPCQIPVALVADFGVPKEFVIRGMKASGFAARTNEVLAANGLNNHTTKLVEVPVDRIHPSPIRHRSLTQTQQRAIYRIFKHEAHRLLMAKITLVQTEVNFMRDADPNREITIWRTICETFDRYVKEHPEAERKAVAASCLWVSLCNPQKDDMGQEIERIFRELHPGESCLVVASESHRKNAQ
jgi:hypothetical protein